MSGRIGVALSVLVIVAGMATIAWKAFLEPGADDLSWGAWLQIVSLGAIAVGAGLLMLKISIELTTDD